MTLPTQMTLEQLDDMERNIQRLRQEILDDVAKDIAKVTTVPVPERPIENPIAQLSRLRAVTKSYADENTFATPGDTPPVPRGVALPPPPPPPYFDRPVEFDTEPIELTDMVEVDTSLSNLPVDDSTWRDMMFKPGMAAAMMFVLQPVVEAAVQGQYTNPQSLIDDLQVWDRMTIVEQVALTELFAWVEMEVARGEDSMIPPPLRANMQRAYENYMQGSS